MKKMLSHSVAILAAHLLFLIPCKGNEIKNQPVMTSTDSLHYIQLPSGIRLAYSDEGAGTTTLIFLHGLGSNHKAWQKNISALASKYRCIAPDLPGYGASQQGDYAYDMTFFANTVRELADALHLKNVVLAGHSMGSQIALHCVLQAPQRWQKLVLLAPAGFETFTDQERAWFQFVYTPDVLKATPPEQIRKNFEINFFHFPEDAEFMIADRMALRSSESYDAYCHMIPKCVQGMLREPVFERLREIRCPTLVMYGENDYLIPNQILHKSLTTKQVAESGKAQMSDCTLKMLPRAGHFVQWEAAEAANTEILNFLQ
ncbi:MAG: alpha/beta hydrolase [Bacteroidetes bacterium]|nr:alpha/beta hydrolase [Bacteroidota bacterium]